MNIQEATKIAMEKGKAIYREAWFDEELRPSEIINLIPTNTFGYIVFVDQTFTPMWNPKAEDLISNDWIVPGIELESYK